MADDVTVVIKKYSDPAASRRYLGITASPQEHARNIALSAARRYGGGTTAGGTAIYKRVETAAAHEMGVPSRTEQEEFERKGRIKFEREQVEQRKHLERKARAEALRRAEEAERQRVERRREQLTRIHPGSPFDKTYVSRATKKRLRGETPTWTPIHPDAEYRRLEREYKRYVPGEQRTLGTPEEWQSRRERYLREKGRVLEKKTRYMKERAGMFFYTPEAMEKFEAKKVKTKEQFDILTGEVKIHKEEAIKAYERSKPVVRARERERLIREEGYAPTQAAMAVGDFGKQLPPPSEFVLRTTAGVEKIGYELGKVTGGAARFLGFGGREEVYATKTGEIIGSYTAGAFTLPVTAALTVPYAVEQFYKEPTKSMRKAEMLGQVVWADIETHPLEYATLAAYAVIAPKVAGKTYGAAKGWYKAPHTYRFTTPKGIGKIVDILPKKPVKATIGKVSKFGEIKFGGKEFRVWKAGEYRPSPKAFTLKTAFVKVDPYALHPGYEKVTRSVMQQKVYYGKKGITRFGKPEKVEFTKLTERFFKDTGEIGIKRAFTYKGPRGEAVAMKGVIADKTLYEFSRIAAGKQQAAWGIRQIKDPLKLTYDEFLTFGKIQTGKEPRFSLMYDWAKPKVDVGKMFTFKTPKPPKTPFVSGMDLDVFAHKGGMVSLLKQTQKIKTKGVYTRGAGAYTLTPSALKRAGFYGEGISGIMVGLEKDLWGKPTGRILIEEEFESYARLPKGVTAPVMEPSTITTPFQIPSIIRGMKTGRLTGVVQATAEQPITLSLQKTLQLQGRGFAKTKAFARVEGRATLQRSMLGTISLTRQMGKYGFKTPTFKPTRFPGFGPSKTPWHFPVVFPTTRGKREPFADVFRTRKRRYKKEVIPRIPLLKVFDVEMRTGKEIIQPAGKRARKRFAKELAFDIGRAGYSLPYKLLTIGGKTMTYRRKRKQKRRRR